MLHPNDIEFARNAGFMSEAEQGILNNSTVAIAGAGGDGGELAIQLARMGVGTIRLADPDPFEAENINRQACANQDTIGVNKAVAVATEIGRMNSGIDVQLYTDGINRDNVTEFVAGADLVIDETEFTMQALGVMLARAARQQGTPNLMAMNIGFGATVTSFAPKGKTFESMIGLSEDMPIDEVEKTEPQLSRWLPYVPPYADLDVFKKVGSGEKSAPSLGAGVAIAAGMATAQAFLHLVGTDNNRPKPITAPRVLVMDAMTGESKNYRLSPVTHYRTLGTMLVRNMTGRVPKASY